MDSPGSGRYRSSETPEIKRDASQLARILERRLNKEERSDFRNDRRQGTVDTCVVHRLRFQDVRVFKEEPSPHDKDYDAVFVLDRSGSMTSDILAAERATGTLLFDLEEIDLSTRRSPGTRDSTKCWRYLHQVMRRIVNSRDSTERAAHRSTSEDEFRQIDRQDLLTAVQNVDSRIERSRHYREGRNRKDLMTEVPDEIDSKDELKAYIERLHEQIELLEKQLEEADMKNLQEAVDEVRDDIEKVETTKDSPNYNADNELGQVEAVLNRLQIKTNETTTSNRGNLSTSVEDTVGDILGNDY